MQHGQKINKQTNKKQTSIKLCVTLGHFLNVSLKIDWVLNKGLTNG